MSDQVTLLRRFVPSKPHYGEWSFLSESPAGPAQRWNQLETLRRVLIIAEPGAGKTYEAQEAARRLKRRGKAAFFIRIEALDASFADAFEVGSAEDFAAWLKSTDEAWFFLDSVDEAQLETPRALEVAIALFGAAIRPARERAHIFITSREDAWQALPDRNLVERHLPFGAPDVEGEDPPSDETPGDLAIFRLAPLNCDEIKLFAAYCGVGDPEDFFAAIEHANLMAMAERPFDLKALIAKWKADRSFGSRLEVLQRVIELQLASRAGEAARAREGACALAAAVTMTGQNRIALPGAPVAGDRIDPADVLQDWAADAIEALLRMGIFDDVVYGTVRFRHREIRELLTAEWAHKLLQLPGRRADVESLFFRTQYGEEVLVPRLRPTLAWLILFDDAVCDRALTIDPAVASEGGDPSRLKLGVRRDMLVAIVDRIVRDEEDT